MDKREDILKAASAAFQKYGLAKTTLDDISHECGIKTSALYYYFKSKDEILNMMFDTDLHKIQNNIRNAVESQNTPQEKISAYMIEKLNSVKEQRKYFYLIRKYNLPLKYKNMAQEHKQKFDDFKIELLTEIISDGIRNKTFNVYSIESLVHIITGVTLGLSVKILIDNQDVDISSTINSIIQIILHGIEIK
ncbi:MAG: hypothetical protein APR54_08790 [Candidatus Cloacimonas sp. SDB]|nr:MAG: hypothetical protein APR54_08790 [Candidatus Cloacimonas sp. SDB]